jgi:hypothetical protein
MNSLILFVLGAVAFTFACKALATYVARRESSATRRDSETVPYGRTQLD